MLVLALVAAVLVEAYYIYELRSEVESREEEMKIISQQLQSLKNDRATLSEELTSLKKAGEEKNGNTPEGQH